MMLFSPDSDGDSIVVSSNEELQVAIGNRTDDILRLNIQSKPTI